jgi:hypothetical protein
MLRFSARPENLIQSELRYENLWDPIPIQNRKTETRAPRFPGRSGFEVSSIFLELIFKCELEKSRVVVGAGRSDLTEGAVLYRVTVIGVWRNL